MNVRRPSLLSVLAIVALVASTLPLLAVTPPDHINFQGVLRDDADAPRDGSFDMTFRFFDFSVGGSEVLYDEHLDSGTGAVQVERGLFSVALGSGAVFDGSGPGVFNTITDAATDPGVADLWLQIEIDDGGGVEVLSPRIRVISEAFALQSQNARFAENAGNADSLGGLDGSEFLDVTSTDQTKAGSLTLNELTLSGNDFRWAGPDRDQDIVFFDSESPLSVERLRWDDSANRLIFTDDFAIVGPFYVGSTSGTPVAWNQIGSSTSPNSGDVTNTNDLYVANDIELGSALYLNGLLYVDDDGPEGDQSVYFYEDGSNNSEFLRWADDQDRFELSDALALGGVLTAGSTTTSDSFNRMGTGTSDSGDMGSSGDLYVSFDLEVGDQIYLEGGHDLEIAQNSNNQDVFSFSKGIAVGDAVGENVEVGGRRVYFNVNEVGLFEFLEFFSGEFFLSDDLDVGGTLTANAKNFVQAHPQDAGLEIVYTTLEGPEAGVYTRGSARLEEGEARVTLDDTFAWVANPDLGLTASLTPRGAWGELYVASLSSGELVVRAAPGTPADLAFDYVVMGVHVGYEEAPVVRPKTREASLPSVESLRAQRRGREDLARFTPLARYARESVALTGNAPVNTNAEALRVAIGMSADVANGGRTVRQGVEELPPLEGALRSEAKLAAAAAPVDADEPLDEEELLETAETGELEGASVTALATELAGSAPRATEERHLALRIAVSGEVRAGDVLVFDVEVGAARRATVPQDVQVIGVALDAPATDEEGTRMVAYAVAGVVTVQVDASADPVLPGDLLVSSPTPGHAMRGAQPLPGSVVGKALERVDGMGEAQVLVTLR